MTAKEYSNEALVDMLVYASSKAASDPENQSYPEKLEKLKEELIYRLNEKLPT